MTLEPCTKRGPRKTPCADRIIASGVKHVVIGIKDPNPEIFGKGEERLKFASGHLQRDKLLVEQKLISQKEFEETRELVVVREKELQEANERLKLLLAAATASSFYPPKP